MNQLVFGWIDYILFISLLGVSLLIGFYFGFCSKQDSVNEYLFGGKAMGYVPVAISILASIFSGITLLGMPTEVYLHGSIYFSTLPAVIFSSICSAYVTLPMFYKLQVTSSYDYLELRFSKKIKNYASILYILTLITYIPIVVYGPAIAFSQATGYSLYVIAPVVCIICITYTTIGGVKAVVWTDTVQFIFTGGGLLTVLIVGVHSVGGFSKMWQIADDGGRLNLKNFDISPFEKYTFWNMLIGTIFSNISYFAVGQKFVQRYLSIGNLNDMKKAVWLNTIAGMLVGFCTVFIGLAIYTHYHDCDPISTKIVERGDQIVPYYVLDIMENLPGVPGIFFAAVTSSALSTMSASINSLSGIVYDNFIAGWIPDSPSKDTKAAAILKILSVIIGVITIGLIFALDHMGTIFELSLSLRGALEGTILGFFLAGMCIPWIGNTGAITGASASLLFMIWIVLGSKWHSINKTIRESTLPLSTENCTEHFNITTFVSATLPPLDTHDEPLLIFRISFFYYVFIGSMITVIVALMVSIVMKESNLSEVNPEHVVSFVKRYLPKKKYEEVPINDINQFQDTINKNHQINNTKTY